MPRNNPTRATLSNKVRARFKPNKALFIRKLRKLLTRDNQKSSKRARVRPARAQKAPQ